MVPDSLPRVLLINNRLTQALVDNLSPYQIWVRDSQQHAQNLDYGFADLALAKSPNNGNFRRRRQKRKGGGKMVSNRQKW
jgi:hypothetical protein